MQLVSSNTDVAAPRFGENKNVARRPGSRVYAAFYSDGWLKVGMGMNPEARISAHTRLSVMRGAVLVGSCISGPLLNAFKAESELVAICAEAGTLVYGREWFTGVDFERVCELINSRFAGDSDEVFAEASKRKGRIIEFPDTFLPDREDRAWAVSVSHAEVMLVMYRNDGFGGDYFRDSEQGFSPFLLSCAIAVHSLDQDSLADLYAEISSDPEEAMNRISGIADGLSAPYRTKGVTA